MPYRRTSRSRSRSRRGRSRSRSRSTTRFTRPYRPAASGYYRTGRIPTKSFPRGNTRGSYALGAPSYSVQTGRLPFARGGLYRLPYSDSFAISASGTSGLTALSSTFVLNGPYDPLTAIGGMQPLQWDQTAFMYNKYLVHKAVVTVTFNNPIFDGMLVGLRVRSNQNNTYTTSGRSIAEVKEMDNTRSCWVNNTGNQTRSFKFMIRPWDIAGISRVQYITDVQSYQAAINANPTWLCFLEPFALHTVFGEDNSVRCTVRIVYYVQFMEGQTKVDL